MHKEDEKLDAWLIFNETELSLLSTVFVATNERGGSNLYKYVSFNNYIVIKL